MAEVSAVARAKVAVEAGEVASLEKQLAQKEIHPDERIGSEGFSLVHWACYNGKFEVLQKLLLAGGNVNLVEKHGWTPAHVCAIRGENSCLQALMSSGVKLMQKDNRGYTCAHLAAAHGNSYTLQTILKTGFDTSSRDGRKWTLVHNAAYHGRYGAVQLLAKWGANLMQTDTDGNCPAHLAAAEGHLDCLRLLVYYNHEPLLVIRSTNNMGASPRELAIQFQKQGCADFLSSAEAEAQIEDMMDEENPAHQAASAGNLQLLSMLILEGHCNVNARDALGSTPAHKAAGNGQLRCLQWLLDHGADIVIKNNAGENPLSVAQKYVQVDCISLLQGKDVMELETEENIDRSPESVDKAKTQIEKLAQMLEVAKTNYRQLGGVLDEDVKLKEIQQKHGREVDLLRGELEREQEKREEMEREMDHLRRRLHLANKDLMQLQTMLAGAHQEGSSGHAQPQDILLSRRRKPHKRAQSGGAYFRLDYK